MIARCADRPRPRRRVGAVIASTGTTVAVLVAILVLLGLAMIAVALWLVRSTRTDPAALAPLEVMGDRRWRKGDADARQANLETARPPGAPAPTPMVPLDVAAPAESRPHSAGAAGAGLQHHRRRRR